MISQRKSAIMKYCNFCLFVLFCLCFVFFILFHTHNHRAVVAAAEPISDVCLGCIFSAVTGLRCDGECGLFKVTRSYWADAGKPTVKQESPDTPDAYTNCTNDLNCAAATVTSYVAKFAQVLLYLLFFVMPKCNITHRTKSGESAKWGCPTIRPFL